MPPITSFRDLLVWQKAIELAVLTYRIAQRLPRSEQDVLGYQLRKSSLSIPSNIAEGWSRR
jgi:four helix bundle protein